MEKPGKLADLKLVNKYYPTAGIANYSYPSPKMDSASQCERLVGRSSVGSQASVPGMVDDQDSDISVDEDDRDSYHISGAELWDSFWEDPFWEANAEEAFRESDGLARNLIKRTAGYPALIPSPDGAYRKDQYFLQNNTKSTGNNRNAVVEEDVTITQPLKLAEPPHVPRLTVPPKTTYSLFPRPMPTPVVNLTPRRPVLPPRSTSLLESPMHNKSTVSLCSLGKPAKVRRSPQADSDSAVSCSRLSWTVTHSAPVTPTLTSRPPSSVMDLSARRDSSQSFHQRQRFPIKIPRTRSDTLVSRSSIASTCYSPPTAAAATTIAIATTTTNTSQAHLSATPSVPSPAPKGRRDRYSQPEVPRIPSHVPLQRCMTETTLPSYLLLHHQAPQGAPPRQCATPSYGETPPPTPAFPGPGAMPVSVFELDSDTEEEDGGGRGSGSGGGGSGSSGASFARRLARSLASHKRTRSASAAPRSRKGMEVAKGQLRRARAGTVTAAMAMSSSSLVADEVGSAHVSGGRRIEGGREEADSGPPALRRQKSEVFGKLFGSRR